MIISITSFIVCLLVAFAVGWFAKTFRSRKS